MLLTFPGLFTHLAPWFNELPRHHIPAASFLQRVLPCGQRRSCLRGVVDQPNELAEVHCPSEFASSAAVVLHCVRATLYWHCIPTWFILTVELSGQHLQDDLRILVANSKGERSHLMVSKVDP